jgi:hypothetical protein
MRIEQTRWTVTDGWQPDFPGKLSETAQLVLMLGSRSILKEQKRLDTIKKAYPNAHFWGCSTAGEICGPQVFDESLVLTAVHFEYTSIQVSHTRISHMGDSYQAGVSLAKSLDKEGLVHVLVLSDGLLVNGSDLVRGLSTFLPEEVTVTGGLSGDGDHFEETIVLCGPVIDTRVIAVLGLYGDRISIGFGSLGGWDPFGPERLITKSKENILFELDGKSALDLYKQYLGEHADGLPATGLLFPLSVRIRKNDPGVVRTILAIDEKNQSMTFAGNVPEGAYARLMKANFDRLIDGAVAAAKTSFEATGSISPDLAILISCVGRKMVLKQRVEEEIEGVQDILGKRTILTGFYSYGEICPFVPDSKCELHNQTMTITTLTEK